MKKSYYILIVFLSTVFSNQLEAKNYIWLHGLNDNNQCWSIYDNTYTKSNGYRPGYSSNQSIENIANSIGGRDEVKNGSSVILIGHSMGGLVAREIESKKHPNVKGIITIGTPHRGAYIENSVAKDEHHKFISNVSNKFTKGILATTAAFIGPFSVLKVGTLILIDGSISYLTDKFLVPYIADQMADGTLQSEKQMMVGSTYMNKISDRYVDVPILTFATEEDRGSFARLAYCASNKHILQTDSTVNNDGSFDKTGYNYYKAAEIGCYSVSGIHAACVAGALALGWWSPYGWWAAGVNTVASTYWLTVGRYLNNGLEYDYSVLLGAYEPERRSYSYERLVCNDIYNDPVDKHTSFDDHNMGFDNMNLDFDNPFMIDQDCYYETVHTTQTVAIPNTHDGLITTHSQQLDKSKGVDVIWSKTKLEGVNHMEQYNHFKTKKEFERALTTDDYHVVFNKNNPI